MYVLFYFRTTEGTGSIQVQIR